MSDAILGALIAGAFSIAVAVIQNNSTRKLMDYKISELTRKVELHNQVIERTYKLEEASALHEEKIKVANHRLDDLERNQ